MCAPLKNTTNQASWEISVTPLAIMKSKSNTCSYFIIIILYTYLNSFVVVTVENSFRGYGIYLSLGYIHKIHISFRTSNGEKLIQKGYFRNSKWPEYVL